MSYIALATHRFEAVMEFYIDQLGLRLIDQFERTGARGAHIDLGSGAKLEILDASRQSRPMTIQEPADDRIHVVIETDDIINDCKRLSLAEPKSTSWGAKVVALRDPDGVSVWFLQWEKP
jgi:catechol 2,3-dioxygenase-like lactoylglutathione lyase family enzyme